MTGFEVNGQSRSGQGFDEIAGLGPRKQSQKFTDLCKDKARLEIVHDLCFMAGIRVLLFYIVIEHLDRYERQRPDLRS